MNRKTDKIIFYAPVGNLVKGFKSGGAEAGCRKTIEVLQKAEYDLLLIEKPGKNFSSKKESIRLIYNLINVWFKLINILTKHKNSVLHIAGFYRNQIYFEWLLIKTARILNVKTIYEIRNGGMIEDARERGAVYNWFLKSTFLNSNNILCQGYDYVVYLKQHLQKDSVYYPNYIMDNFVSSNNLGRKNDSIIRLIYFGRVVADKNIEFIIEVCSELKALGLPYTLDIIGSYEESYYELLNKKITDFKLSQNIHFHGRMEFTEIYNYLKNAHFFLFPSKEKREGHSNALTEAMGCGVVPIVSNAGFNESIVGNKKLAMQQFEPEIYAKTIYDIWSNGEWDILSDQVYKRIINNYTETVVKKALIDCYINL